MRPEACPPCHRNAALLRTGSHGSDNAPAPPFWRPLEPLPPHCPVHRNIAPATVLHRSCLAAWTTACKKLNLHNLIHYIPATYVPVVCGFIRPLDLVPCGSVVHFTAVIWLLAFAKNVVLHSGIVPFALPEEPHTSTIPLLIRSAFKCVRLMDALTDMMMIRVLLDEVRPLS